jgi:hypothetical protein
MPDGMGVLSRCAEKPFSLPRGDRSRAFAFGELLFFAGAKKSNQKKAPSSTSRSRCVGGEAIFGLGILPRSENGGHPWPPPLWGFRMRLAAAGMRRSRAGHLAQSPPDFGLTRRTGDPAFDFHKPAVAVNFRTPGGRPAWMPAVFGSSHGWRVRKWRWVAAGLNEVDPPGCFLWLLSLHQQRK